MRSERADGSGGDPRSASKARSPASQSLDEDRILRQLLNLIDATRAHQLLPARGRRRPPATLAFKLDSARIDGAAGAAALPRDLGLLARASKACICASRRSRAAASAGRTGAQDFRTEVLGLVQGAAGQERGHRAGRRQGRLRAQAPADARGSREEIQTEGVAAYQHLHRERCSTSPTTSSTAAIVPPAGVVRHDGDDPYLVVAADKGTATFSDTANAHRRGTRLLARRRLRLRRLGRLRPQGHGHHGARRLGVRQAAFPRDGHRHPDDAVPRRRRRRHVRRRVRQRHAAVAARSGWSPPSIIATSSSTRSRSRPRLRRAQAAVRAAALELAGLRRDADLGGRRRLLAQAKVDPAVARDAARCSASTDDR